MPDLTMLVIGGGVLGALLVLAALFSGPSAARRATAAWRPCASGTAARPKSRRRSSSRRSWPIAATRPRVDGLASSLIPNPALLRQRLAMTGKSWTLTQYVGCSLACSW
jgi:tight adherence protein B